MSFSSIGSMRIIMLFSIRILTMKITHGISSLKNFPPLILVVKVGHRRVTLILDFITIRSQ